MLDMSMRRGWEGVEATGGRADDDSPLDRRTCVRVPLIAVAVHGQSRPLTGARGRGRGIISTAAPALLGRVSLSLCVSFGMRKKGEEGTGNRPRWAWIPQTSPLLTLLTAVWNLQDRPFDAVAGAGTDA